MRNVPSESIAARPVECARRLADAGPFEPALSRRATTSAKEKGALPDITVARSDNATDDQPPVSLTECLLESFLVALLQ